MFFLVNLGTFFYMHALLACLYLEVGSQHIPCPGPPKRGRKKTNPLGFENKHMKRAGRKWSDFFGGTKWECRKLQGEAPSCKLINKISRFKKNIPPFFNPNWTKGVLTLIVHLNMPFYIPFILPFLWDIPCPKCLRPFEESTWTISMPWFWSATPWVRLPSGCFVPVFLRIFHLQKTSFHPGILHIVDKWYIFLLKQDI